MEANHGEIETLNELAYILYKEPKELSLLINQYSKTGLSYPSAREQALLQYLGNQNIYKKILSGSNNILGIEYLKALHKSKSNIRPLTIQRDYAEHTAETLKKGLVSSTGVRNLINNNKNIHQFVPYDTYELLEEKIQDGQYISGLKVFEKEIIYTLRRMNINELASLPDVSEGLENRIKNAADSCNTLDELLQAIKTKRFTQTRIQRILLYALLNISKKDMISAQKATPYIRILGFNKHGKKIISAIAQNNPKAHIIISVKKFMELNNDPILKNMLVKDILATNIFTLGYTKNSVSNLDFTHKIIEM